MIKHQLTLLTQGFEPPTTIAMQLINFGSISFGIVIGLTLSSIYHEKDKVICKWFSCSIQKLDEHKNDPRQPNKLKRMILGLSLIPYIMYHLPLIVWLHVKSTWTRLSNDVLSTTSWQIWARKYRFCCRFWYEEKPGTKLSPSL